MIHPQAIIHKDAKIGANVEIGAFSIIGEGVEIGDNTWVGPHVVINGPTVIGKENKIYQFCSIGEIPQHKKHGEEITRLTIGDRNIIREYCTINRGTMIDKGVTIVGSDNFIMAYVHIAHDCIVGNHTIFANCASLAGHVKVGDHAVLGGFTGIHQFCQIGPYAMTAIATISFKDIPPFVMTAGNTARPRGLNVRGLQRNNFSDNTISILRKAYKILYRSGLRLEEAMPVLAEMGKSCPEVEEFREFIASSDRGIVR
ncbi:MAG: acyl-ACP--UDP-N-acetylglucosamine O-acyltransferase [Gammaproteobacteria bacterium]|nr:acyl-ACP--UDP-N-acetylglucosamine O-acyltransferase [Gammaproteobacteria bacterium]